MAIFSIPLTVIAVASGVTGLLGYKLGEDNPQKGVVLPTKQGISPFEIGTLLIMGLLGILTIRTVSRLWG